MTDTPEENDSAGDQWSPVGPHVADALFGSYSILGPGVQIILDGEPVSAPADD